MAKSVFLQAEWRDLIMLNYAVDPAVLHPYLPVHTELDLHNGNAYVSIVGFLFANTRLLGVRIPFHVNFEEVNLRFYVRYRQEGKWKRGTVFIREIVPKAAISFVANNLYNEKYITLPMRHYVRRSPDRLELGYHWKFKGKWNSLEAVTCAVPAAMLLDSEESFIAEHYWGYSRYNEATTYEYEVVHPPWQVYPVHSYHIDCDFAGLYGPAFAHLADRKPASVLVAQGSPISILRKTILAAPLV